MKRMFIYNYSLPEILAIGIRKGDTSYIWNADGALRFRLRRFILLRVLIGIVAV